MSRVPVVAGSPQTVSATAEDQKKIVGQSGTVAYTNPDGSGSLTAGQSVTVEHNTTLSVSSGRGYVTVLDVAGAPDYIRAAAAPWAVTSTQALWDYNAADYISDTSNATAELQDCFDTASAAAAIAGRVMVVGIPPGVYDTDAINPPSNIDVWGYGVTIRKRSNSASSAATSTLWRATETLAGDTYYGAHDNITLRGITFSGNGKTAGNSPSFNGSMLRFLYVRNMLLEDITVSDYCNGSWALNLGGTGTVRRLKIRGGDSIYEDGLHLQFGDWTVEDYDIESGDDAISLGCEPDDPYITVDPQPLTARIGKGRAVSADVCGLKIYQRANATADMLIHDIDVEGIYAWGKDAAAVWVNGLNLSAAGAGLIKRVKIRGTFVMGDSPTTASDDFGGLATVVAAQSVDQLDVAGNFVINSDDQQATGWRAGTFTDCQDPIVNLTGTINYTEGGVVFTRCPNAELYGTIRGGEDTPAYFLTLKDSEVTSYANLLNQATARDICYVDTGSATSTLHVLGGKWSHASGATAGLVLNVPTPADLAFLHARNWDVRGCYLDTGSSPARPLGTNIGSIAAHDIANCPGLLTRARGNTSIGAAGTTVTNTPSLHLPIISHRQVEQFGPYGAWGTTAKLYVDNITATTFRLTADAAPGATLDLYYVIDVGKKPAT